VIGFGLDLLHGTIVASTAFAAGIIDQPFYAVLVLLAIARFASTGRA
jgi:hypothetical protein